MFCALFCYILEKNFEYIFASKVAEAKACFRQLNITIWISDTYWYNVHSMYAKQVHLLSCNLLIWRHKDWQMHNQARRQNFQIGEAPSAKTKIWGRMNLLLNNSFQNRVVAQLYFCLISSKKLGRHMLPLPSQPSIYWHYNVTKYISTYI